MIKYQFSDSHVSARVKPELMNLLLEVQVEKPDYLIGAGDVFEAARWGWKELVKMDGFLELSAQLSLVATKTNTTVILIEGNHDFDLYKHSQYFSNCIIKRKNFVTGNDYHTHGWQEFDYSFGWIEKNLYGWLFPFFPKWQYLYDKYAARVMQNPGIENMRGSETYWRFVNTVHARAMDFAIQDNVKVIFGHTHEPEIRHFPNEVGGWVTANCGDFMDSNTALIIEDDIIRQWRA